jgi:hypothetical protein
MATTSVCSHFDRFANVVLGSLLPFLNAPRPALVDRARQPELYLLDQLSENCIGDLTAGFSQHLQSHALDLGHDERRRNLGLDFLPKFALADALLKDAAQIALPTPVKLFEDGRRGRFAD